MKGQEVIVLTNGRRRFGICLLKECDWKGTFGKGDKRNLETLKTTEIVRRSPRGEIFSGNRKPKTALYQLFDRLAGFRIWKIL